MDGLGLELEQALWADGHARIAGIDEVGRGCGAGPVVACALTWPADVPALPGVRDSKVLARPARERLAALIATTPGARTALGFASVAEIDGDAHVYSIAAASIVAKVARDRLMALLDARHPGYGWARNAGYLTPAHLAALRELGITAHHRRSFAPVAALVQPLSTPSGARRSTGRTRSAEAAITASMSL
jgi:ribonuclease HII